MDFTGPNVVSFLRRSARIAPHRPAVAYPNGEVSYSVLLSRVESFAAALPHSELGEAIGIVTEHDVTTPELYLGVMASGNAVVPLSSRLPDAAIADIADAAGIRLIVVAPTESTRRAGVAAACAATEVAVYGDDLAGVRLPSHISPVGADIAMVSFTSGTTGSPKGVLLTHTNLIVHGLTAAHTYDFEAHNVAVNAMPLAHFAGASRVILGIVEAGTHVILPRFVPADLLAAAEQWRATHTMVVPTMVADLLDAGAEKYDLSRLTLIYGAAPMPMPVAAELVQRLKCKLVNGYGLTESSALATALGPQAHRHAVEQGDLELLASVGHAVAGVEVKVIDADGRTLGAGEPGEIALRGAKVSPGYLNNPAQTAKRFVDGWLHSGDRGRMLAGDNIQLLGRLDDLIITGGMNVQPEEIETQMHAFDGIAECAVFPVASERWGQEVRMAVVTTGRDAVDVDDVRRYLLTRLDQFKVPKQIHIVDQLPKTSVGKVRRRALSDQFAAVDKAGS